MQTLLHQISKCDICKPFIEPRPVVKASPFSKIIIIGQAPGTKVHASGIPWDDASGKRLRSWLSVTDEQFYNPDLFGIIPMGFCYPGKGTSGDLPPRKECAPKWHPPLFEGLENVSLVLLIGMYAQKYYLKEAAKRTLTDTVNHYENYLPKYFVLPHPSPRNGIWLRKNAWFEAHVIPELQNRVRAILD